MADTLSMADPQFYGDQQQEKSVKTAKINYLSQSLHIVYIALIIAPNQMFYSSSNILDALLTEKFGPSTVSTSYVLVSVPSIITIVSLAMLIDAFGTRLMFPFLQLSACIGTLLCAISDKTNSVFWFYFGRFIYGIVGECTQTAQSKLISQVIDPKLHSAAFGIANCAAMCAEVLSGWMLPLNNRIFDSMMVILGWQLFGFVGSIFYTIYALKYFKTLRCSCEPFTQLFKALKTLRAPYFFMVLVRVLYYVAKACYDSRSVSQFQQIYGVQYEQAKSFVALQLSVAVGSFIFFSVISPMVKKNQYLGILGIVLNIIAYSLLFSTHNGIEYTISSLIGVSGAVFVCNTSSLLLKAAGNDLGASAIGIVYSLEYLLLSGFFPLAEYISTVNVFGNAIMFVSMTVLSLLLFCFEISKWTGW
ncbi:Major_facilitator superfamily protein [Hexamita inflata]|uniref:Lysosomal dipeptide transporter MFSD1 n=1 Tax=Hexamita inflata TaxID=28002 RepID=A0AA86QVU5_9EUKA|nr:Major facilitator superfamily protein [Hexamita inflata]